MAYQRKLREEAVKILRNGTSKVTLDVSNYSEERLIEELYIHEIELEIQNDELRESELMLSLSNQKYRSLLDQLPFSYVILNKKGIIIEANQAAIDLLNFPIHSPLDKHISRFVHDKDRESFIVFMNKLFKSNSHQSIRLHIFQLNKEKISVNITGIPYNDGSSNPSNYILTLSESSDYVKVYDFEDNEFSNIDLILNQGLIITDEAGVIKRLNPFAYRFFHFIPSEIYNISISDIFTIITRDQTVKYPDIVSKLNKTGIITENSNDAYLSIQGILINVNFSGIKYITQDGTTRLAFIFSDVSERIKLIEERFIANSFNGLSKMAGKIAHDFNNMFTTILLNLEYLDSLPSDESPMIKESLSEIERTLKVGMNITRQLQSFTQNIKLNLNITQIKNLIQNHCKFIFEETNVTFDLNIDDEFWPVNVDAPQISTVISNILENAKDSIEIVGKVVIRGSNIIERDKFGAQKEFVKITIEDNGCGIDSNLINHIFNPFFTTKSDHIGLGLTLSYAIVSKHNGRMIIESKNDLGTTVTILLPAYPRGIITDGQTDIPRKYENFSKLGPILVMDDNIWICQSLKRVFEKFNIDTYIAYNGSEAISEYQKKFGTRDAYKLVILDLVIDGDVDGEKVNQTLLEFDPNVITVCMSGYSDKGIVQDYQKFGFKYGLQKPFTIDEIIKTIKRILDEERLI